MKDSLKVSQIESCRRKGSAKSFVDSKLGTACQCCDERPHTWQRFVDFRPYSEVMFTMHLAPSARGVSRPERFGIIEWIAAKLPALPSGAAYCRHLTAARIQEFHYVLRKSQVARLSISWTTDCLPLVVMLLVYGEARERTTDLLSSISLFRNNRGPEACTTQLLYTYVYL